MRTRKAVDQRSAESITKHCLSALINSHSGLQLHLCVFHSFCIRPDGAGRALLSPAQIRPGSRILVGTAISPRWHRRLQLVLCCCGQFANSDEGHREGTSMGRGQDARPEASEERKRIGRKKIRRQFRSCRVQESKSLLSLRALPMKLLPTGFGVCRSGLPSEGGYKHHRSAERTKLLLSTGPTSRAASTVLEKKKKAKKRDECQEKRMD